MRNLRKIKDWKVINLEIKSFCAGVVVGGGMAVVGAGLVIENKV